MNFAAIFANPAVPLADRAPSAFNGHAFAQDVASPVDHIDDKNLVCLNQAGQFCLRSSMAHAVWVGGGSVQGAATAAGLEAATKRIALLITMQTILRMLSVSNVALTVRSSDTLHPADLAALIGNEVDSYIDTADKFYDYLKTHPKDLARLTANSDMVLFCLMANACHRKKCAGHNWFTDKTNAPRTETNRILAVAGESKLAFGVFMLAHGHDLFHFIPDACLHEIALSLSGTEAKLIAAATFYRGVDVGGLALHETLDVGEAARDRYPVGQLGVSSTAAGLDAIAIMVGDLSSKVKISNAAEIMDAISHIKNQVTTGNRTRAQFLLIKGGLTGAMVMAYGYITGGQNLIQHLGACEALASLAASNPASASAGTTLANRMREVTADPGAIGEMIRGAITQVAAGLALVAIPRCPDIPEVDDIVTRNQIENEVKYKVDEASRRANVMAAIEKMDDTTGGKVGLMATL